MKNIVFVVLFSLMLQGCLVIRPDGPRYSKAPMPPQDDSLATIYMYYQGQPGARIWFYVNGKEHFNAHERSFSWVQVMPGEVTIKAQAGFWDMDLAASAKGSTANDPVETVFNAEAGRTYYLELHERGAVTGQSFSYVNGVFSMEEHYTEFGKTIKQVEEDDALRRLTWAVYIPPT